MRFAPSPTGELHVGGVRTALFNWLYARHWGGKFLLRIEDTDQARSTPQAVEVILTGLKWLGIEPDEEILYQSQRIKAHQEAAQEILSKGLGYRCFCDPEKLAQEREMARSQGVAHRYDRRCLRLTPDEVQKRLERGDPYAIRVKVPDETIGFQDGVHGWVEVSGEDLEDFVILRRDGTPTYHLAVVVDDAFMGITHIIRGDEHLLNTPKQIILYRALEYPIPHFAHVPLILGPDKKKLSKRHGATSITWYKEQGYLAEVMVNYLGLLGWSPGDDRNFITREELIRLFDIPGIMPHGAIFDEAKLRWLNAQYLSRSSFHGVKSAVYEILERGLREGKLSSLPDEDYLSRAWELIKSRIYLLTDLITTVCYLFEDPEQYDPDGVKRYFTPETLERLEKLSPQFESLEIWSKESLEAKVRQKAEEWGIPAKALIHPLRLAVSGVTVGPGLFELLEVLGREKVVRRLERAVSYWYQKDHLTCP
ncbi:MAG: glutamate--tRNA ligase [bacterium]